MQRRASNSRRPGLAISLTSPGTLGSLLPRLGINISAYVHAHAHTSAHVPRAKHVRSTRNVLSLRTLCTFCIMRIRFAAHARDYFVFIAMVSLSISILLEALPRRREPFLEAAQFRPRLHAPSKPSARRRTAYQWRSTVDPQPRHS